MERPLLSLSSPRSSGIIVMPAGMTEVTISVMGDSREVRFTVIADTAATYPVFPRPILESLAVEPVKKVEIELADGSVVTRLMGDVLMKLNGEIHPVPVIFGEEGDTMVLGVTALEIFGLTVDPVNHRLIPARILWFSS